MEALQALINLSQAAAIAPALTQGGGGNTSFKNGSEMLIKASGFRLDEVSATAGFVKVNYPPVVACLRKNTSELPLPDADLKQLVNDQIIGDKTFLPSMETGFHAVLNTCVIHTHPIVANLLLCAAEGELQLKNIFKDEANAILPFLNPGYFLSKAIADLGKAPAIIFLKNHGLIVHGETVEATIALQNAVIEKLNTALDFNGDIQFELKEKESQVFELKASWLDLYFSQPSLLSKTYFPDQAVVIGQQFHYGESAELKTKLNFNTSNKICLINAPYKTALAIAENLSALAQITVYNQAQGHTLTTVPDQDVAYILGMDMEKYRQALLGIK